MFAENYFIWLYILSLDVAFVDSITKVKRESLQKVVERDYASILIVSTFHEPLFILVVFTWWFSLTCFNSFMISGHHVLNEDINKHTEILSPEKALHAAMLKRRFANIIFKATHQTLLDKVRFSFPFVLCVDCFSEIYVVYVLLNVVGCENRLCENESRKRKTKKRKSWRYVVGFIIFG